MSYTSKNLNTITILLTILIFICLYVLNCKITVFPINIFKNCFNTVYSKVIPIEQENETIKKISENIEAEENENVKITKVLNFQQENKTQRDIINENKNNKWRIQIHKIGLDVHIKEGTSQDVLLTAVGHFIETSNWNGNVGLAAHNRGYKCNFFEKIRTLKLGDEITYCSPNGKRIYKIIVNKVNIINKHKKILLIVFIFFSSLFL